MRKAILLFVYGLVVGSLQVIAQEQVLSLGNEVTRNLNAGEEHWFNFQASETGIVIVFTSGNTDTYLEAYDSNNNLIGNDDDEGEGDNARLEIRVEAGKTYQFKVKGYNRSERGTYRIIANFEQQKPALELVLGSGVSGNLGAGEEHWFSIRATEAGRIVVFTSGNTDTYLEAYDSNNNRIGSNDDGGEGTNAQLEIRVEPDKIYLFKLRGSSRSTRGSYRIVATNEEQRQETIRQERLAQEEAVSKAYQQALASRNVDTIMQYIQSDALSSLPSDRRTELRIGGYHEAAKIITRNNNIRLGDFTASWERFFSPREPPNPNAFDKNVVYYLYSIRPTQLVQGMFVVRLGSYPEDSILLLDIPSQVTRQWGVTYSSLFGVLMKYDGLLPMQLPNGRTTMIPSFVVLYHYRGE